MNFSTAANVLRRSARPHESFMAASASAGHHLAAAKKEAGWVGGEEKWHSQGHAAQMGKITAKDPIHRGKRLQIQNLEHLEDLFFFKICALGVRQMR